MIEHLVLSGGSYNGIKTFGILYELSKQNFYNINNIKSIYCTSVGSIVGSIISLNIDNDVIYNYIHKRPWYKITNIRNLSFNKKGLLDKNFIEEIMNPVLQSKNLNKNITLLELYNYNSIELHIFTTKLTDMSLVDISYKTHPNIEVIDALYMSSAIPYFFEPFYYENDFYIDGGVLCNFPIDHCNYNPNTILGIYTKSSGINNINNKNNCDYSMIEYFIFLNYKLFKSLSIKPIKSIKNNIKITTKSLEHNLFYNLLRTPKIRLNFLVEGQDIAKKFLEERESDSEDNENSEDNDVNDEYEDDWLCITSFSS